MNGITGVSHTHLSRYRSPPVQLFAWPGQIHERIVPKASLASCAISVNCRFLLTVTAAQLSPEEAIRPCSDLCQGKVGWSSHFPNNFDLLVFKQRAPSHSNPLNSTLLLCVRACAKSALANLAFDFRAHLWSPVYVRWRSF